MSLLKRIKREREIIHTATGQICRIDKHEWTTTKGYLQIPIKGQGKATWIMVRNHLGEHTTFHIEDES